MESFFKPSRNCHRLVTAHRAAVVIDGADYYQALHQAFRRAASSIFIVGWDLHSEVRLIGDNGTDGYPGRLGALLDRLADRGTGHGVGGAANDRERRVDGALGQVGLGP